MLWRIYYGDGSTYSDEDGSPYYAPKSDVQAIAVADPAVSYIVLTRADFYCYDPEWSTPNWRTMDDWGFTEYMREPGPRLVLFGKWVGNHEYQALITRISNELGERQRYPNDRT